MRIAELTAFHCRIPLKKTIQHASATRSANDTLIVRCRLDDGSIGWGEGLPRPYVTGETIDTALQQLRDTDLTRQLDGSIADLGAAIALCQSLVLDAPSQRRDGRFGNSVRCAIEVSILDAVTRALGLPFSAVVDGVPEAARIRRSAPEVRYGVVISAGKPASELWSAIKYRLYGFEQCKLKVGIADRDDAGSLARIRWVLPRHKVDLRVDANEAWTLANIEAKTAALRPYGITALEQPVPDEQTAGLAALRSRLGVPIMLDESLCSLIDARRAIEQQTCDLFNIRLSKCGGFVDSLKIAALAHEAGLGYQLGCLVGETGILSAAGRHFATAIDHIRYLEGSYDRHLVSEPLTREDLTFGLGGRAPRLEGAGLGITIDEAALERVKVAELHCPLGNRAAPKASPAGQSQTVGIGDV